MERWGWKKLAVLYGTEPWAEGIYSTLLAELGNREMQITNPEEYRAVPNTLSFETASDIEEQLRKIIDSDTRVLVFMMLPPIPEITIE